MAWCCATLDRHPWPLDPPGGTPVFLVESAAGPGDHRARRATLLNPASEHAQRAVTERILALALQLSGRQRSLTSSTVMSDLLEADPEWLDRGDGLPEVVLEIARW